MAVATPLSTSAPDPRAERAQRPMAQLARRSEAGRAPPAGDCLTVLSPNGSGTQAHHDASPPGQPIRTRLTPEIWDPHANGDSNII